MNCDTYRQSATPQVLSQGDLFGLPKKLPSIPDPFTGANRRQRDSDSLKLSQHDQFLASAGLTYREVNRTDIEVCLIGE